MNPYAIIGILVVWALSLVAVGTWQHGAGEIAERTGWQTRENNELVAANARITQLTAAVRDTERAQVRAMDNIAIDLEQEKENVHSRKNRDTADALNGTLGLRIRAACPGADRSGPGQAGPATAGGDGAQTIELPRALTASLYGIVNDADAVADQLRACQRVISADRAGGGQ